MSTPVLVVGAGPAGLTTAVALARRGVEVVVVERRAALSGLPRAASVSIRTMELLRSWGLEDEIRAGGVEVEWKQWVGPTLAEAGQARPTSFPTHEQSAVLSPAAPASVPQDHLEPVLLKHLRSLGVARVELGTEVVDLHRLPHGVQVTLRDVATGETRSVRARYLVGADGARSTVREALGIGMRGPGRLSQAVSTQFRAPLWDLLGDRRYCIYAVTHREAGGVLVVDFSTAAESVLPGFVDEAPRDLTVGDITVSGSNTYDVAGSRLLSSYVFTRGAQETRVTALHHLYTVAHLRQLLADGGFTDIEQYGGPDGEPFEVGTRRLLLTAHRSDRPAA